MLQRHSSLRTIGHLKLYVGSARVTNIDHGTHWDNLDRLEHLCRLNRSDLGIATGEESQILTFEQDGVPAQLTQPLDEVGLLLC